MVVESPKILLMEGRYRLATKVLRKIRGIEDVYAEIASIVNLSQRETFGNFFSERNSSEIVDSNSSMILKSTNYIFQENSTTIDDANILKKYKKNLP